MKKLNICILALFILLAGPGSQCMADFYGYTDSSGVLHVTNIPTSSGYELIMRETPDPFHGAVNKKSLEGIIHSASSRFGVDPSLVTAVIKAESDFDAGAVSPAGAVGLMQLMPETANLMGVRNIRDPVDNIEGGTRYLSRLLRVFDDDMGLAVAAYNAGENAVLRYGAIPPFSETRDYVDRVMYFYDLYRSGR